MRNTRRQASIVCCALTGWQRWPALCEIPCCSSRSMRRLTTRRSKATPYSSNGSSNSSSGSTRRTRPRCSTCCRLESPSWRTLFAEYGRRATLQSGTTAPPSTRAVADYDDQYRRLNRVTLPGDIPIDVHGPHSRAVVGDVHRFRRWSVPSRWRADYSRSISRDINAVSSQTCRLG